MNNLFQMKNSTLLVIVIMGTNMIVTIKINAGYENPLNQ